MTKKLMGLIIVIIGLLCAASLTYAASTSELLDYQKSLELIQSITGSEYKSPYVASEAGSEDISPMSGALNIRATDLVLPGKNGFDLVISRTYNSQIMDENYYLTEGNHQDTQLSKYAYQYTYGDNQTCYIVFDSEEQMIKAGAQTSFMGIPVTVSMELEIEMTGFVGKAYYYSHVISGQSKTVKYTRKPGSAEMLPIGFSSARHFRAGFQDEYDKNSKLGQGWQLELPKMSSRVSREPSTQVYYTFDIDYCTVCEDRFPCRLLSCGCSWCLQHSSLDYKLEEYEGTFQDEMGQQFTYVQSEKYEGSSPSSSILVEETLTISDKTSRYEGFQVLGTTVNPVPENKIISGITYDRKVTNIDSNITYYFDYYGNILAKEDKFKNVILYYYDEIQVNIDGQSTSKNCLDYLVDSYGRTIDFVWSSSGELSKITYGDREINYQWASVNNSGVDPRGELKTDNSYSLTVTNEAGETTLYRSKLVQPVYYAVDEGTDGYNSVFDNAYLLEEIQYPTGGKTVYTYLKKQIYMAKKLSGGSNAYIGKAQKFCVSERKDQIGEQISNHMLYNTDNEYESLMMTNNEFKATVTSKRGEDGAYDYYYDYTYLNKRLEKIEEWRGSYRKETTKSYWGTTYGQPFAETVNEYMTTAPNDGLNQISNYSYDEEGSLLTTTNGQTRAKYRYNRVAHLADGTSFPKTVKRQAVSNGKNRETVTISDYVGRPAGHSNMNLEGVALWRESVWDDALEEDEQTIIGGEGTLKYRRYYTYNTYGEVTEIKTYAVDSQKNDTGTPDVVSYQYAQETGYGTDLSKTRTVTEIRQAEQVVQEDGSIAPSETLTKTMTFDYYGNLIREEGDGIDTICYTYDNKNRLLTSKVMEGSSVFSTVSYDYTVGSDNTQTLITNVDGKETLVKYDSLGRYLKTILDPDSLTPLTTESVTYDELGRVNCKTVSKGAGAEDTYQIFTNYWSSGKLRKQEIKDGAANSYRTIEYEYKESWPDTENDPYEPNTQKVIIKQTDGNETRESASWVDVYGNTTKQIDPAGGVTTFGYDARGVLKSMKNPKDNADQSVSPTESYTYDYRGEVTSVTNAAGNTATTYYDYLGRAILQLDYSGNPTFTSYYKQGQVSKVSTLIDGYTGEIGPSTNPDEDFQHVAKTLYYYDQGGNLAIEKVQNNTPEETVETYRQVSYGYDTHNRLDYVKQTEDDGSDTYTKYFYDLKGNPTKVVTGLTTADISENNIPQTAAVTSYEYHPYLNKVTKMIQPDGTVQYWNYNYWGQVEEQGYLNEDGTPYGVVTYNYNTIGELLTQITADTELGYTYNKFGDVIQLVDDTGTRTFAYDNAGRLSGETGTTDSKTYTYDINGNRASFTLQQDSSVIQQQQYEYDRLNRLTAVKDASGNLLASYTYDANGNLLTENKGGTVKTNYTYNMGGQMTKKENKKADNSIISSCDYTYYLDGNIKSENTRSFAYDNLGRLKKEQDGSDTIQYTYDRFGNRSSMDNNDQITNYAYDLNNRLLKEISMSDMAITYYNYDDRGNLYSKRKEQESGSPGLITVDTFGALKDNTTSTVELYSYDGLNRLEEVRKGGTNVSYEYNAAGIRTSKTVNGVKTDFMLDGANVVAETKNGTTTNYIRGVSGIISSQIGSSTSTLKYYSSDGHGNITNLMNNSGAVVKTYSYDAFGVEQDISQSDPNPFRYCGEYYDTEINQIYLRARYYNPNLGRFTQQDTHWNSGNMIYGDDGNGGNPSSSAIMQSSNLYVYAGNNPIMFFDPSGETFLIAWSYGKADLVDYTDSKGNVDWKKFTAENSFARAAATRRQELIDAGIPASDIDVQRIDNEQDMKDTWKMWSGYSSVERLDVFSHGSSSGPIVAGGGGDFLGDAAKLNWKESLRNINGKGLILQPAAIFHGCNTANGSFAQNFANKQGVTTYAQAGNASFSTDPTWHFRITDKATTGKVYLFYYDWNNIKNTYGWGKEFKPNK